MDFKQKTTKSYIKKFITVGNHQPRMLISLQQLADFFFRCVEIEASAKNAVEEDVYSKILMMNEGHRLGIVSIKC